MEKYVNGDGEVGVLVSRGYGAGWSTWSTAPEFMAMDKTLVQMKLDNATEEEVQEYLSAYKHDVAGGYTGGWNDCVVVWLDKGQSFRIDEYDGSETITTVDSLSLTA